MYLLVVGGDSEGLKLPMNYDLYTLLSLEGGSDGVSCKCSLCLWGHGVIDTRVGTAPCLINSLIKKPYSPPIATVAQVYYTV